MSIVKDCGNIWARLFDHQHFLQPEINSFVKEFEEKRSDREVEHLLDILNVECELSDQCDKVPLESNVALSTLNDKVKHCLAQTDRILNDKKAQTLKHKLNAKREQRKQEWETLTKSMECKYVEIDAQFTKEEDEIRKFYKAKEKNL